MYVNRSAAIESSVNNHYNTKNNGISEKRKKKILKDTYLGTLNLEDGTIIK